MSPSHPSTLLLATYGTPEESHCGSISQQPPWMFLRAASPPGPSEQLALCGHFMRQTEGSAISLSNAESSGHLKPAASISPNVYGAGWPPLSGQPKAFRIRNIVSEKSSADSPPRSVWPSGPFHAVDN